MDLPQTPPEAEGQAPPIQPVDAPDGGLESQDAEADDASSAEEGSGGMIGEG